MRVEDVIDSLNVCILEDRKKSGIKTKSFLTLQYTWYPDEKFKLYKTFKYIVWFINDGKKYDVLTIDKRVRCLDNDVEDTKRAMEKELCTALFTWKGSYSYEQVVSGIYGKVL